MFRPEAVQGRRQRPTIFDLPTQFLSGVVQYLPSSSQIGSNSIALVSRGFNDLFTVNEEEEEDNNNDGAIQSPSLRQLIAEGVTSLRLDACRQARRRRRPVITVPDFPRGPFPRQRLSAADYFDHGFALALDGDYFHPGDRLGQGGLQRRLTVKLDGGGADLGAAGLLDSNFNAAGQVLADTRHLATDQELSTFGPLQNIGYPWSVTAGRRRKVFKEDDLKECDDLFDEIRSTPTPGYDLTLRTADSVRRLVGTFPNVRQVTLVYTAPFFGLHSSFSIGNGNEMASPTVIPLAEAWPLLEDLRLIGRVYEGDVDVQVENQEGFDNFLKEDLKKTFRTDSSEDSSEEDSSGSSSDNSSISTSSTSSTSSSSSISSSSSSSSSGTTPSSNSIFYYHGRRTTYENVYGSNNSSNDFNADDMEEDDRNDDDNDDDDATTIIVGEFSGEDTEDEDEGGNRNNGGDGGDGGNNLEMNVDDGGEVVVGVVNHLQELPLNNNNNDNPDQHFGGIPNIDNGYEGDDDYSGDDQNDQKEENSSDSKSDEEKKPMEEGSNEKEDSKIVEKVDSERFEKSSESTVEMAFEDDDEEEEGEEKEKEGVKVRMRLMPDTKKQQQSLQSPQSPPTAAVILPAHVQAELARRTALVRSVYAPLDGLAHLRHLTTSATVEEVLTGVSPVVLRRLHSLNLVLAGDCLRHWTATATAHLSSSSATTENTAHNDEFELLNGAFNRSTNDGDPPLLGGLTSLGLYLETAEYSPSIELLAVGGARVLRRLAFRDRIAPKTIQYIAEQFKHSLAYLDFAVDRYTAEVFAEPVEPVNKADKDDPEVDQMDVKVSEDEGNEGSDAKKKDKEPEVGYYYSLSKLLTTLQQLSNLVELHFSYLPTEVITLNEVRTLRGRAFLKMATEKWVREITGQLSFPGLKRIRAQFWTTLHALPHLKAVFPDAEEILFTVPVAKKGLEDSLAKLGIAFEDLLCEDYLKSPQLCSGCASAHHLYKECLRLGAKTVIISVLSKDDSNNDSSSCWALEPSTTNHEEEEVELGQVSFFLNEKNYIN